MTEKNILAGFKFFSEVPPEKLEKIARLGEVLAFVVNKKEQQFGNQQNYGDNHRRSY